MVRGERQLSVSNPIAKSQALAGKSHDVIASKKRKLLEKARRRDEE